MRLDGDALADKAAINAAIDIPDAKRADPRLAGKAAITASLTGSLAHPDVNLKASLADGKALGRPVPHLDLDAVAHDVTGALDAELKLAGEIDRKPLQGGGHLAKQKEGGWLVDRLAFNLGSVALQGTGSIDTQGLANGSLSLKAGNLDDLSPLLLTKLTGDIAVEAALDAANGTQNAKLSAHAH